MPLLAYQDGARGIHTAAMKGHVSVINTLLNKGENVDATTNVSPPLRGQDSRSPCF